MADEVRKASKEIREGSGDDWPLTAVERRRASKELQRPSKEDSGAWMAADSLEAGGSRVHWDSEKGVPMPSPVYRKEQFRSEPAFNAFESLLSAEERMDALAAGRYGIPTISYTKTDPVKRVERLLSPAERAVALISGHLSFAWVFHDAPALQYSSAIDMNWHAVIKRGMVCVLLVLVNTNDTVLKAVSQQRGKALLGERYLPSSVMLVSNMLSVLVGNVSCLVLHRKKEGAVPERWPRWRAFQSFWAGRQLLQMSLPAVLFTLSGTLKFVALGLVPPDVVITLEQGTVLLCAVMGWAWLKKEYTKPQWAMLLLVTCGLLWYQSAHRRSIGADARANESLSQLWAGLLLMCGSVVMVTAGGLSCEVLLKGSTGRPFYIQKAQMEFSMAAAGFFYCMVVQPLLQGSSPLSQNGLLYGWDGWTVAVLVLHTAKSWLATTTVLLLDNLTYTLAGNVAMLLVYVERLLLLSEDPRGSFEAEVFVALLCTALGVFGFAWAKQRAIKSAKRKVRHLRRKKSRDLTTELGEPLLRRISQEAAKMEEAHRLETAAKLDSPASSK